MADFFPLYKPFVEIYVVFIEQILIISGHREKRERLIRKMSNWMVS